jgi:hypothetical protein
LLKPIQVVRQEGNQNKFHRALYGVINPTAEEKEHRVCGICKVLFKATWKSLFSLFSQYSQL